MHREICGENYVGVCESMDPVDGELLKHYLLDVKFKGIKHTTPSIKFFS